MAKIKTILRLHTLGDIMRSRLIARASGCGRTAVQECLKRAKASGLTDWAAIEPLDEDTLEARLYPRSPGGPMVARNSVGYESAAQLLLTAGDNPDRLRSEASFAALCGVSPIPASSGKVSRHRLNRGGDRAANSALHIIAIGRLRTDPRTRDCVQRRISEGHSKLEAIRCIKRYIAREVFFLLTARIQQINQLQAAA